VRQNSLQDKSSFRNTQSGSQSHWRVGRHHIPPLASRPPVVRVRGANERPGQGHETLAPNDQDIDYLSKRLDHTCSDNMFILLQCLYDVRCTPRETRFGGMIILLVVGSDWNSYWVAGELGASELRRLFDPLLVDSRERFSPLPALSASSTGSNLVKSKVNVRLEVEATSRQMPTRHWLCS
jgi:hypothetical protein